MPCYTEQNTEGYSTDALNVLNAAYEAIIASVDAEFEADTHAVSDNLIGAYVDGDTVHELVVRFRSLHPKL